MADQGDNQQSELPRRMFQIFCLAFLLLCIALPIVADESPAFPPIGNRYENIPEAAKAAVSVLKKLRVSTETGVEFADYDRAVSEGGMLVKAFVKSDDAREMPELCLVLGNATDCYLKVRELWLSKIESDGLGKKHEASALLATAQPLLWRAGGENISAGVALTANPTNE